MSKDLTQVLYLVDGGEEIPLSYVPPGFEPNREYEVIGTGPRWFREREAAKKVYLHPSISYGEKTGPRVGDLLGGDGVEREGA